MNQPTIKQNPRHFVLVHGACHGAWCWYKVSEGLTKAGHKVTAVDLAASGLDPRNVEDVGSVVEYSEPLISFLESVPEKVVIVAHSLGGYSASIAMERFPEKVSLGVFVTASMLGPEFTYEMVADKVLCVDCRASIESVCVCMACMGFVLMNDMLGPVYMETKNYRNSPREDLELGLVCVRPTPVFDQEQAAKDTRVTKERYGTIPRVFVLCDADHPHKGPFQWWQVKNNPPNEYVEIEGSDHMVMFSKPGPLSEYLIKVGQKYA
ncbi:Methyl jasmonate esterase 1 [Linum perenne]